MHAVSSEGAVPVHEQGGAVPSRRAHPERDEGVPRVEGAGEWIAIDVVVPEAIGKPVRFVHAAGPAKAMEIARRVLTLDAVRWEGCRSVQARRSAATHLCVGTTDDIAGAEIARR